MNSYGAHLMGDLRDCERTYVLDGAYLYKFLKELVTAIGMEPMGSPHLDLYTGPQTAWDGFSGTVHIQSSHITCHVFAFGYVFIDIFSCKPINVEFAKRYISMMWKPESEEWQQVFRGRNFPPEYINPLQLQALHHG